MKELRFTVENQPGALAKVATAFGEEKVNIEGISGTATGDTGLICLVTDNPGNARNVLQKLDVAFEEKDALVIDIPNHPGELGKLLDRLAEDGLNVESAYAAVERNRIVLTVNDVGRAKKLLRIA